MKPVRAWLGLVNGKPCFEFISDSYCEMPDSTEVAVASLYKSEKEVSKRYQTYQQVELRPVKRGKKR